MTIKTNREVFEKLAEYCDGMETAARENNVKRASMYWEAANAITTARHMSTYEDAIAACFDMYDSYKSQDEYMFEHSDEWSYDTWHLENVQREKYACATQAQQELVRQIFGVDEETVHNDLVLWRRYIDLHFEVAGMRACG